MDHNKPDEYYIEQTLSGNTNAYAFLVEKYKYMVFTLAYRIVKNKEETEEVSQDVFVKAFSKLSGFKGEAKFSTWIYKITYFASLDVVKRKRRQINSEHIDAINEVDLGNVQDALDYLHDKERKEVIKKALMQLSEVEQTILTLYYFEEMPLKEVSKVVNLTVDNIKIKLYRSRKKLMSILKHVIEPRTIDLI